MLTAWHCPHSHAAAAADVVLSLMAWASSRHRVRLASATNLPGTVESVDRGSATHTHTRLTAPFPGLPRRSGTRKVKPIWILLKQETVSGSGISWAICKSAPGCRLITMPAPHHSVVYRPDAFPAAQPTASKHWRHWRKCFSGSEDFQSCL